MSIESIKQNKGHYGIYNICKSKMQDNTMKNRGSKNSFNVLIVHEML